MVSLSEIKMVNASGTIYIRADGSFVGTDKIYRDENVYTFCDDIDVGDSAYGIIVERDNIVIDGKGFFLKGQGPFSIFEIFSLNKPITTGISLEGRENVTVKNLQIRDSILALGEETVQTSRFCGTT